MIRFAVRAMKVQIFEENYFDNVSLLEGGFIESLSTLVHAHVVPTLPFIL